MRRLQFIGILSILFIVVLAGCQTIQPGSAILVNITLIADGNQASLKVSPGATVQTALNTANITLNNLDRVEPPTYTVLSEGTTVKVVRVAESFEIEEIILPFERQTVPNESLPENQRRLVQAGSNGLQQITYRIVTEDGVEVSRNVFQVATVSQAIPEIEMIGVQRPFTSTPIAGKLAYLTAGNAWVMDGATGDRRPVVTSTDLDGRIFSVSPDGEWLLYTRKPQEGETDIINSLWVINLADTDNPAPIDLEVTNIIHYAGWNPNRAQSILYSTVEPRSTAPGWQANNDLQAVRFTASEVSSHETILEANIGGIYGWWGTSFAFSPDGSRLAYARPDSIGLVDLDTGETSSILDILPLQTRGDWAWVPGIGWSHDGEMIYLANHVPLAGLANNETSPLFNVTAIELDTANIPLVTQTGMFAYPVPSPEQGKDRFQVAYLQAYFPEQSENSRYRLMIMDRDGSNSHSLFPSEGLPGLDPQRVVWSPSQLPESPYWLAFVYQGNLWLVDPATSEVRQITGDGLITNIDWK